MSRVLVMAEREVETGARETYLRELAARRLSARMCGANFWVFEQSDHDGRFLEFTEAANEAALSGAHEGVPLPRPLWREVEGA